jgi:hypothetical protein
MPAYYYSLFGLFVDIAGAFLLAVEAIKIDNIIFIQRTVFAPFYKIMRFVNKKMEKWWAKYLVWVCCFLVVVVLANIIYKAALREPFDTNMLSSPVYNVVYKWVLPFVEWIDDTITNEYARTVMRSMKVMVWAGWAIFWSGVAVVLGVSVLYAVSVVCVEGARRIVDNTPNGTCGVIGFLLLFTGFIFQMLGTYWSAA